MQLKRSLSLVVALSLAAPLAVLAQEKGPPKMPPGAKAPEKPKQDFPPFEDTMKDYVQVPTAETPFITLWHNKKTDSLRAQIPAGLVGQQFLIATSMSGGAVATGFQLDHYLAYFERMDKSLVLMQVDPRYVEGGSNPMADVIERSYGGDIIVKKVPIITMNGGDPVVDLDDLFKADFSGIGQYLGGGGISADLSKWAKFKAFPENVELSADLAFMNRDGGKRMRFHYSLSKVPETATGYQPRAADDRIGYFLTVRKDWSKEHNASTLFNRYINRWRLEKRDPTAELSAPKNPIVWHIEKTVPLKYRRWVKEGILEWNKAYEKCGFLDAIEVKQQEDYDKSTKDLDPEDVRYNFFRWIVTGRGFAMGPSRAHPLTGQIFDADIVFDDAMVRHYVSSYDRLTGGEDSWEPYNPYLENFYQNFPQYKYRSPRELLLPGVKVQHDENAELARSLMKRMHEQGKPMCECASGMAHQMQFAGLALEAQGLGRNSEEFIGQIIKEIVMHEVGHCLGLRHNFKASTWLEMKDVEASVDPNEANAGSVMDYNPAIIAARGDKQTSFVTRTIGPYDFWAIEYGYRPVAKPYTDEKDMLAKIGSRVADAGLDYSTDEDTMGFLSADPYSNRFDMGKDPMGYAKGQIKLIGNLIEDISKWAVKDGESYTRLRRAFTSVMGQRGRVVSFVARFPGGQVINRDHKADPNGRTPIQVVPAKDQREALEFVCENVFGEKSYNITPDLLSHLAPGRYGHWDSDEFDFFVDFNIHDFVAEAQFNVLVTMMNPFTIGRIHDNQVKFGNGDEVYSLAEHINGITDAVWSELDDRNREGTEGKPFVNSFRRNLQRNHIQQLLDMVVSEPGGIVPADANAISRLACSKLSKKIETVLKDGTVDTSTEAHLSDVKTRVDRALEAQYQIGSSGMGGMPFFFFHEAGKNGARGQQKTQQPITVLPSR
ncbi:MAG TPA: zinc-dependent metalloprotease [Phycisphaerae bacterium]|nr:zinc-dependent metalloprotease [Phycisphaerae bacterium]